MNLRAQSQDSVFLSGGIPPRCHTRRALCDGRDGARAVYPGHHGKYHRCGRARGRHQLHAVAGCVYAGVRRIFAGTWLGYARTSARVASGLGANLREVEYRKIQTLAFGNLDNYDASSLVTRMTTDITVIQNAVGNGFRPMVRRAGKSGHGPRLRFCALARARGGLCRHSADARHRARYHYRAREPALPPTPDLDGPPQRRGARGSYRRTRREGLRARRARARQVRHRQYRARRARRPRPSAPPCSTCRCSNSRCTWLRSRSCGLAAA